MRAEKRQMRTLLGFRSLCCRGGGENMRIVRTGHRNFALGIELVDIGGYTVWE